MGPAHYPEDYVVCRRCRRPLDRQELVCGGEVTVVWTHPLHRTESHDPEPVRASTTGGEVVAVCDFCTKPGPQWVIPCKSFTFGGRGFAGDWAACTPCKDLLLVNDLAGLAARAIPASRGLPAPARAGVLALFRCLRANQLGDPESIW